MKIAIAGTRGIPNRYGGFEQCAQRLSVLLKQAGHEVIVYNPSYHDYDKQYYEGVEIVKQWNPEKSIGTVGNFIYDYRCMKHAIKSKADVILMLGYTTSSVSFLFLNLERANLVTNMDGMEWKRGKWNPLVRQLTKWLEKLAVKHSAQCIADNTAIQQYLSETYKREIIYIPYGADEFHHPSIDYLSSFNVKPFSYDLVVARLEKENNIEMIIGGALHSGFPLVIIGGTSASYAAKLVRKYGGEKSITFAGPVYDKQELDNLRYYSRFYFHGHSVGGTNPSLLEAMATSAFIIAHDNPFNRTVLGDDAFYFDSEKALAEILSNGQQILHSREELTAANRRKISEKYRWEQVAGDYLSLFERLAGR